MSFWRRAGDLFRRGGGGLEAARRAEVTGKLKEATALYLEAEAPQDASRILELRADRAAELRERLSLLKQAAHYADDERQELLERQRARLTLDFAREGRLHLTHGELSELGQQLERLGKPSLAADAYGLAGDAEEQARALVAAGAIEKLERVLTEQHERHGSERRRAAFYRELCDLELAGQRRRALERIADSAWKEDDSFLALRQRIEAARLDSACVHLLLRDRPVDVVFGDNLVLGRTGAQVEVPSPAVSRAHLGVRRGEDGAPEVVDLGSRNGTLLGGARLAAALPVGSGVELSLGGSVSLRVEPREGGVLLALAAREILAPLGPFLICDGETRWSLEPGADDWLELSVEGGACWLDQLRVTGVVQLARGDVIRANKGSAPLVEVPG